MRNDSAQRCISASETPCPSWPSTQAHGHGSLPWCIARAACELVASIGTRSAASAASFATSTSRNPKCAPMPARSTFGDQSAAVPLIATTCPKPKADALRRMLPTLPASCSRSSTTLGACASSSPWPAQGSTKPSRAGDSRALSPVISGSGITTTEAAVLAIARDAGVCQPSSVITACAAMPPRCAKAAHRCSPSIQTSPSLR